MAVIIPVSIYLSNKSNGDGTYKDTLDKQGGSVGTSSVTATIDENMPRATAPSKSGCVFAGYYSETNGLGTQYYSAQMMCTRKLDIENDSTLYAYWISGDGSEQTTNTYTVTLDRRGGTGGSSSVKATNNQPMPAASMPTRNDYTFGGFFQH